MYAKKGGAGRLPRSLCPVSWLMHLQGVLSWAIPAVLLVLSPAVCLQDLAGIPDTPDRVLELLRQAINSAFGNFHASRSASDSDIIRQMQKFLEFMKTAALLATPRIT